MDIFAQVEAQRIIGFVLISLVYVAVVLAWSRHGTRNVFLAYTSLLLGTAISLVFAMYAPELTILRDIAIIIVIVGGSTFFFLSAYQTNKRLEQLTNGGGEDG